MDYLHESAAAIYRRRRRRRTVITLICMTLLLIVTVAFAASNVRAWLGGKEPAAVGATGCGKTTRAALAPSDVTINVYNATNHAGLAATVARSLEGQGFLVATIDNDPLEKTISTLGEIRHGPSGAASALLAAARMPGARIVLDDRMDASVDLVLGSKFSRLRVPPKQLAAKSAGTAVHC